MMITQIYFLENGPLKITCSYYIIRSKLISGTKKVDVL